MYQFDPIEKALLERSVIPQAVYQFVGGRVVTLILSEGFLKLFGFTDRARAYYVMDNDMYCDTHPDDAARIADAAYRFAVEGGVYEVVYRTRAFPGPGYTIVHARGEHVYTQTGERLAVVSYTDEGPFEAGEGLNGQLSRALLQGSRMQSSYYDSLTGLPNMSSFFQLADGARGRMRERGQTPAVLYFDLNGMKIFNEKYGFSAGDRLLQGIARALAQRFGNENCGRFGQDHFAAITETEGLAARLDALFQAIRALNEGKSLPVRVGVYRDEQGEVEIDAACDRAKAAADQLRLSRLSRYAFFNQRMQDSAEQRQYILDNFDRALAEGWVRVYYQPIVRTANGRVCDEEALARWLDPVRGLLSPAEFIPILEDARLIYRLDLYVLEQALAKMRRLEDAGLFSVPVSLNLSRSDFECCDIVEEIRRRVEASGVSPSRVTIEITESMIGGDVAFMKTQIDRLHALGFPVWMDDFGSEYSSLDYLQSLRFDLLKFDMRFMQQFDRSERSRIILTELVKMAIGLGIDTIAEGVETREQVDFLTEIGCTKLQGYYFSKPLPLEEILRRYEGGTKIGFENPAEEDYYAAIGRINLYDLAVLAREDEASLQHFFNTIPMAIIESDGESFTVARCNQSYRAFLTRVYGFAAVGEKVPYARGENYPGNGFLRAVRQCALDGTRTIIDEELTDGSTVHAFIKHIAVNPVTGTAALAVAVLAVLDPQEKAAGIDYADIAKALSADYYNLFYVNLETEDFIEYRNDTQGGIAMERRGADFFTAARHDAQSLLDPADRDAFIAAFTKENVVRSLDETGSFTADYRIAMPAGPVYVSMKAVRSGAQHLIIGVCDVDAQTRARLALEELREEQVGYARIAALADDYLSFYTVDPETNRYREFNATQSYRELGTTREGEDFFADSVQAMERVGYSEDLALFRSRFSKEKVLAEIDRGGRFAMRYRILVDGEPQFVMLKAARVQEKDGTKLIFGVSNVDALVKREHAYLRTIETARERDAATGLSRSLALQLLLDQLNVAATVVSVSRTADGSCGELRIVQANGLYRRYAPGFYENILYQELIPRDLKFEDYCFRAAFEGQKLRAYVNLPALNLWADQSFLPLVSRSPDLGYCLFLMQATEKADGERLASVSLSTAEAVIASCVKLVSAPDLRMGIRAALDDIRAVAEADGCRLLLLEHETRRVVNFCDSIRPEAEAGLPAGATPPYELVASWEKMLGVGSSVILTNERELRQIRQRNPLWAESLRENGIRTLVMLPVFHEQAVVGYLYITNFNVDKVVELKELVELMAFFLGAELSNQLLLDRLETLGRTDALTGVGNRAAMMQRFDAREPGPFGVLNLDLNGLKVVNDTEGHEAGDRLIIRTARLLEKHFADGAVYRIGGDEFAVFVPGPDEPTLQRRAEALRREQETEGLSFALGLCRSDGSLDARSALRKADMAMYRDKRAFYRRKAKDEGRENE